MSAISRGSLVRLRPGLPELRVLSAGDTGAPGSPTVAVGWFGPDGKLFRAMLPVEALEASPAMLAGAAAEECDMADEAEEQVQRP